MKKITLQLLFLFLVCHSYSYTQNWPPVGAQWHYTKYPANGSGVSFSLIEVEKDTVVDGKNCKKLMGDFQGCSWKSHILYESNDSIYFYHTQKNEFSLLYDYNASPGDTWDIYNITTNFGLAEPDTTKLVVDSVGQVNISGQNLNVVYTSMTNATETEFEYGGMFIEKISLRFPSFQFCDPVPGELRCYEDQLISYQTGPYYCDEVTLTIAEEAENEINVFPNPVESILNIEMNSHEKVHYKIYDVNNKLVNESELKNQSIDMSFLEKGIYFISIISQENEILTATKIVKL